MTQSKFLGRPTRGGWLTIANCGAWVFIIVLVHVVKINPRNDEAVIWITLLLIAISSPLAVMFWLPSLNRGVSLPGIILMAVLAGLNAIVWGYGLSWFLGMVRRLEAGVKRDRLRTESSMPQGREETHG